MRFLVFGNFPETAWRTTHSRQVAHVILVGFWVTTRDCLAVTPYTAKRRKLITISGFFLMNCLAVMNTRQATRVEWARFWCSVCSRVILIGRKCSSNKGTMN